MKNNFKNTIEILNSFGKLLVEEYKDSLIRNEVNASDKLFKSVKYLFKSDNRYLEIDLELKNYYWYVENGRKAGKFPPIQKIEDWIKIKPVLPYKDKNGKLPTLNQLTYLIGRKIKEKGIQGKHLLQKYVDDIYREIEDRLVDALSEDLHNAVEIELLSLR